MKRPASPGATVLAMALAATALIAGCGSAARPAPGPAPEAPPAGAPFLATSLVTAVGTWAVAVMGGSATQHNNFWQLFIRPAGSLDWKLVTPPGTADNGGLVLADTGGPSLITGFRPSQYLTSTPLTLTRDGGQAWSSTGPLDGALANVPDALTTAPGTGRLLALLTSGTAELATPSYTSWSTLASLQTLGATASGRHCGLRNLTAAAFSPAGVPLLGGTCSRPGTVGIFTSENGTWQAAGPPLPAALARQAITVLRLTRTATRTVALLTAGSGPAASLLAAWSPDSGSHWALSPSLPLGGAQVWSVSAGPGGAIGIVLNGRAGVTLAEPGASWQWLPFLPTGTQTLAPDPKGGWDALAVHGTRLTIWQFAPGGAAWAATQAINVPIQFGSSG